MNFRLSPTCCLAIATVMTAVPLSAQQTDRPIQDPAVFASGVRPTEALDPEAERQLFVLPPGFEIQLVAAEPDIAKPMNLAFDARGRLWVSSSLEYPYAAPLDQPARDTIRILEDTDGDGRADRNTIFADGLNIPIGLYPYQDGVICYSIPNIWFLRDTDGDDVCDVREKLYGPMGWERDTHGMCNAFTRGFDGWLYSCHGFNNQTTVAGRDGHQITMHSGNTFRMRLDGSRIEHFTHGQVNPFGMTFDETGDIFTADCHTKPITLLMQGGWYDSFGRPHDGLGYVPNVMDHLHGSTAIAGIAIEAGSGFPAEYRGHTFGGNVMTSRINRNSLAHHGSSIHAHEEPDFLIAGDAWFRPVDLRFGPDGALYVADFYNRIIGHYEVPLTHPGRDRNRGRIWRIVYTGQGGTAQKAGNANNSTLPRLPDLSKLTAADLFQELRHPSLERRMLAADRLVDGLPAEAALLASGELEAVPHVGSTSPDDHAAAERLRLHSLWILHRLGALDAEPLISATGDSSSLVRTHAFEILRDMAPAPALWRDVLAAGLGDADPRVRREAALATAIHQDAALAPALILALRQADAEDVHLRHALRMALRDQLALPDGFATVQRVELTGDDQRELANICLALRTEDAGRFLLKHVTDSDSLDAARLADALRAIVRQVPVDNVQTVATLVQSRFRNDLNLQLELLDAVRRGLMERNLDSPAVRDWSLSAARRLLASSENVETPLAWTFLPHPGKPDRGNPWVIQQRISADGGEPMPFFCSLPRGEQWTGLLRSEPFTIGDRFEFYTAGHIGHPGQPVHAENFIRLRDAASLEILREASPPRNDTAQRVEWNTRDLKGRSTFVELVDGDTDNAYAWLAVGRFSLARLNPSRLPEDSQRAARLIAEFRLEELTAPLSERLLKQSADVDTARELGRTLATFHADSRLAALAEATGLPEAPRELRASAAQLIVDGHGDAAIETLGEFMKLATSAQQLAIADQLATDASGTAVLLTLIEQGKASPRLLLGPAIARSLASLTQPGLAERAAELTKNLPDENQQTVELIARRKGSFFATSGDASVGIELFRKNCAACHQVAGQGKKVGPNLDGIGGRGLDRLLEDVLAPNRNVDIAFRATTVITKDGRVLNGLLKPADGGQFVLIDGKGQETPVAASAIDEQIPSPLSPMPANLAETLTEDDFRHLLTWLLSLRSH